LDNESGLGVGPTRASHQAVFLSYASEDADAAQLICTALRAAGIEVWFDQSELRGGDVWDAAIKRQIKSCALFMPIISAQTRARAEGYFRLEWKLAIDRSHLIAADKAFLVPVVIDSARDSDTRVPDRFREVQWTRLPGGEVSRAFVERVSKLLLPDEPVATAPGASTAAVLPSTGAAASSSVPVTVEAPAKAGVSWWSKHASLPAAGHRSIVGRARELEIFRAAFDRMLAGRRQLVLISGEPGIGKTRCAEALADMAEDQGALVLWGRCHDEGGAPPYWPWVQILRAYIDASSLDEVRLNMGAAAKDIAALVPELGDVTHHSQHALSATADSSPARFRTFDAIRQFFHQAAQQVPITLVLDNLHWADAPSLSLLEFLSQETLRNRLLIVGTYRDAAASSKTPLMSTLGALRRDSDVERVHLARLPQIAIGEIAERLCDVSLSQAAIKMIHQQTDGNPLFAIELIKVLVDESAGGEIVGMPARIPAGVHETIGRRLIRLSDRCNELLSVAAVHGRQFMAREVAAAMDEEVQCVLRDLQPAVQAGIVQSNVDGSGSYQFTHGLIRDTIYEDLPTVDRLRLHSRAADALVAIHAAHLEPALTRIAYHYHEAAALGNTDKAVVFALRAAESAVRMFAYEDALLHYDHAIEALEECGLIHDERLARAFILKGSALKHLGQIQRSIEVLLEAVNRTRVLGSAELLVDVLMLLAMSSRHVEQQHFVPLLERSLALLPEVDSVPRAKALATLAFAQRTLPDKSRIPLLVDEALAMASRICDATARCACFQLTLMALRGNPESLQRRLLLGEEYIVVARSTGTADLVAEAYHWQALNYFESGQLDELEALLEYYDSLSAARFGLHQYQSGAHRVTLALLRGDWTNLDARIEALLEIGTKTRREDADGVYGAQMFALNRDRGHLYALAPQIKEIAASATKRMWEPGLMLICAEIGLLDEARSIFDRLVARGCHAINRDDMYMTVMVFCAETCCVLADAAGAEALYQRLLPYTRQTANHPTAVCFGATELYLAMLAATANWPDRAREHFDQALTLNRAMRAWPCLARTLFRYGAFLGTRQADDQQRLGLQQLREAEQLARRLEMARLVADIDTLLQAREGDVTFPDDLTAREVEVLQLLAIGRTNKDVSQVLAISLNTVATHVRNILNKTHCANRTEAATYAIRHGLQAAQSAPAAN
jgi:DNA-binding CsgD family transcriptional regulator